MEAPVPLTAVTAILALVHVVMQASTARHLLVNAPTHHVRTEEAALQLAATPTLALAPAATQASTARPSPTPVRTIHA